MTTRARTLVDVEHPGLVWLLSTNHGFNEFFSIIIPPLFPFLVPELGISYAQASLLVVAFFVTYSVVQLPVGRLVDVYDPRRLLAFGQALLSVGIALVAFAPSFGLMLVGMVVAGFGGSTYHPTGMSVISDSESTETHGRSMGIHGMIGVLGPVASPVVMTAVAVSAGWRAALLVGAGLGLVFAVLLYLAYPRVVPSDEPPAPSASLLAAARQELSGTLGETARRSWQFVRSPTMLGLIGLFAVVGAEVRAVQSFTPVFASDLVGTDPTFGNAMLAVTMVAAGLASTAAGYGVDRVDRRLFAGGCFTLTALAIAVLVLVPMPRLVLPVAFAGLGIAMYSIYPAVNAIAAGATTPTQSGSMFAVTQTAAAIGAAVGPYLIGAVSDLVSLRLGFLVTAGIAAVGIVVILAADEIIVSSV